MKIGGGLVDKGFNWREGTESEILYINVGFCPRIFENLKMIMSLLHCLFKQKKLMKSRNLKGRWMRLWQSFTIGILGCQDDSMWEPEYRGKACERIKIHII